MTLRAAGRRGGGGDSMVEESELETGEQGVGGRGIWDRVKMGHGAQ